MRLTFRTLLATFPLATAPGGLHAGVKPFTTGVVTPGIGPRAVLFLLLRPRVWLMVGAPRTQHFSQSVCDVSNAQEPHDRGQRRARRTLRSLPPSLRRRRYLERVQEGVEAAITLEQVDHAKRGARYGMSISLNEVHQKWLPEAREADFVLAQETHLPQDSIVAEESWMRSKGWRACLLSIAATWRVGIAIDDGAEQRKRGRCGGSGAASRALDTVAWRQWSVQRASGGPLPQFRRPTRGPAFVSFSAYRGKFIQENWQMRSVLGNWLRSQAMPFIIGGDFQVEPDQLWSSGWVRAVGGFDVARSWPR